MNKHDDELLKRIETWTDDIIYIKSAFGYDAGTGISTEDLKSLADEYEKLREAVEYAKEDLELFADGRDIKLVKEARQTLAAARQSGEEGER